MKKSIFILLISTLSLTTSAQEFVEFNESIQLDIPTLEDPNDQFGRQPFFLRFEEDSPNQLLISISTYEAEIYHIANDLRWYTAWHTIRYDVQTGEMSISEGKDGLFSDALAFDTDEPQIEGFPVVLEDEQSFDLALYSPTQNYASAIVSEFIVEENTAYNSDRFHIWNSSPLEEIYNSAVYVMIFELEFSASENFFYARGLYDFERDLIDDMEFRDILYAELIHLDSTEQIEANADVAFTSDERYFVTERDEVPTLVDTDTDENLLHYDMPVRMVGATFSPDDQTLYLSGLDNNLYVFDSNLPTQVDDWMLR